MVGSHWALKRSANSFEAVLTNNVDELLDATPVVVWGHMSKRSGLPKQSIALPLLHYS